MRGISMKDELFESMESDNVKFVNLQFTDMFGMVKSISIPINHLENSFDHGTWFDGSSIEGFARIHESDMYLKPDMETYAVLPWHNSSDGNTARFICDVHKPDGSPFEGDPRYVLKKVIQEAKDLGFDYNVGPELEFFLFKRENGKLLPIPHDSGSYFDQSNDLAYDIRRDMNVTLQKFGINVEASHHEVALGQHEIDFKYGDALSTADNGTTFKFVLKAIAQKHGLHATFMPKPVPGINGSGMHVHQSLFKDGENAFFDESNKYHLSNHAYSFIAGQLAHAKAMSAILCPTINSYKRLVPGYEAPVYLSWGHTNRSALIRIPRYSKGKSQSTRCEIRCPDPSCNLYLAFAVLLKTGLDGMKNNMIPPDSIEEDLYGFDDKKLEDMKINTLPDSLQSALREFKRDDVIRDALGKHTFEKYIEAKTKEWDSYKLQVTPWEIENYLEKY
ncbi:glutamine synthetase family protein [Candidatus Micrarchaeota archaeon]|nr:glutamine synthetase family protein [Candidatus Micrarchaeota archaeon]MBU1682293.1 glutamine synthetase family protein [Candidatus Micrarchaeota archaeon]